MHDDEASSSGGLLVWATADQADLVVSVARLIGRPIRLIGGPSDGDTTVLETAVATLTKDGQPERVADLRHAISTLDASAAVDRVLVASRGSLEDAERAALRDATIPVLSLEPRPSRLPDFLAESAFDEVVRMPNFAASPAWRLGMDAIRDFGTISLLEIGMAGRPDEGSLHARLHDAMDILDRLVDRPDGVAAGMDRGRGDVPEHLASLRGSMAVDVRGDDGWCATIACSDAAPSWSRRVTATGSAGRFVLDDAGFTWTDANGVEIERLRVGDADGGQTGSAPPGVRAIAEALERTDSDALDRTSRERRVRRFALCEAARLAVRTGERESPARLAGVLGGSSDA